MTRRYPVRIRKSSIALAAVLLSCGAAIAEEGRLKSGPHVGEEIPGSFSPVNVTNAGRASYAGTRTDYTEQFGCDPVVLVFARGYSPALASLAKKLDASVAANRSAKLRAVVVVLSDDQGTEEKLEALGKEVTNVSLAYLAPPGPKQYKLADAADVTVILYRKRTVTASHAFEKGGLGDKAIEAVSGDVPRLVSRK
jgi:hypothetical protein